MTVSLSVFLSITISGIALACSVYFGTATKKRNEKTDTKEETAQMITVLIELKNISAGITEIKNELNNVKTDRKEDRDLLIKTAESLKSAWVRIKELVQLIEDLRKEIDNKN